MEHFEGGLIIVRVFKIGIALYDWNILVWIFKFDILDGVNIERDATRIYTRI